MMMQMKSIFHQRKQPCYHCPNICELVQHIGQKKCYQTKCWMVFPKLIWALKPKSEILRLLKQPKRNYFKIKRIKNQHHHTLYQRIWLLILFNIIDVSSFHPWLIAIWYYYIEVCIYIWFKFRIILAVNIDDAEAKRRKQRQQEERERNANGGQKPTVKRATDDYHYDKFKKQFRRYWLLYFSFVKLYFFFYVFNKIDDETNRIW